MIQSLKSIFNNQEIDFYTPKIMGIINATPDSFYDGGNNNIAKNALAFATKMIVQGVDIIDIGGQSSQPSATLLTANEELKRVLPIIEIIKNNYPNILLSIDTFYSQVASQCVQHGVQIINDISAGNMDAKMLETVANLQVPYIAMHMQGTPSNMQSQTSYTNMVEDIFRFFENKIQYCKQIGISQLAIDVGFGFGKNVAQNFELLNNLQKFTAFNLPILTGISRKSMVYKTLGITAKEALNGTSALHMVALQNGSNILRVHDVQEAKEVISLFEVLNKKT